MHAHPTRQRVRREWSWALAAVVAFAVGVTCAEGYARLAVPYYAAITEAIAEWHPWKILEVVVAPDEASHGAVVRLVSEVRREREDRRPAAIVVSRVQVGEVIETPIVFWTMVLLWPASSLRQRALRIAVAIPIFLCLEAATTACQLLHPLAEASALLAGERDPLTLWERWSRFLEAGGRFGLEVAAALLSVALLPRTAC
jgi:hypothetical protein